MEQARRMEYVWSKPGGWSRYGASQDGGVSTEQATIWRSRFGASPRRVE